MQCDVSLICPYDVCLASKRLPTTKLPSLYQLYINLMLVYLSKLDEKEACSKSTLTSPFRETYFDPSFSKQKVWEAEQKNGIRYDMRL